MDELDIKGKKYISSKRAAEITGYAKDYVGQLARSGKIAATRFGRAWYVEESAILAHVKAEAKTIPSAYAIKAPVPILSPHLYKPYNFPKTWGEVRYFEDSADLLPKLSGVKSAVLEAPETVRISVIKPIPVPAQRKPEETAQRIKILEDGIIRPNPVLRTANASTMKPEAFKTTSRAGKARRDLALYRLALPAIVAASVLLFFFGVSGLFLSSGTEYTPARDAYTASVLPSFEHVGAILKDSPFVQPGISALKVFTKTIQDSFWGFFKGGVDFIKTI